MDLTNRRRSLISYQKYRHSFGLSCFRGFFGSVENLFVKVGKEFILPNAQTFLNTAVLFLTRLKRYEVINCKISSSSLARTMFVVWLYSKWLRIVRTTSDLSSKHIRIHEMPWLPMLVWKSQSDIYRDVAPTRVTRLKPWTANSMIFKINEKRSVSCNLSYLKLN